MPDAPLLSKLERCRAALLAHRSLLACPICRARMLPPENTFLRCEKGHCFDLSRKGYVNFAHAGALPHYDRALFLARREVLSHGFYAPIAEAIDEVLRLEEARLGRPAFLLDAGCGEGYYAAALHREGRLVFGIDLCRDAVALATQYPAQALWCVADLARLPFADGSMDVVLDVLTPASYAEFARVLAPGGLLIKVIPGGDYLREIRKAVHQSPYHNDDVVAYFHAHMEDVSMRAIRYERAVDAHARGAFFRMTPLTVHKEEDPAALREVQQITIDMALLTGRF